LPRPHIFIVGGTGTFGSRLARLLARRGGYRLTLAARDRGRAEALLRELRAVDPTLLAGFVHAERDRIDAVLLTELGVAVLVDCSGPFQDTGAALVSAAIEARCHYVDLADARAFVAGITRFEPLARAARVAVVAGASTTPALTHAVLDHITGGWTGLDAIDVAIVPGNRTPRGRAVIAGILSWVGQPLQVFDDAEWRERRGWAGTVPVTVEGLGSRLSALAELPDADLLFSRYKPRLRALIRAGLELPVLHRLVGMAGLLVRLRAIRSARSLTGPGTFIAVLLAGFGTDAGGLVVEARGQDARGDAQLARWSLVARKGEGPYVPAAPAAAIVAGLASGDPVLAEPGARSAAGVLRLEQILPWFEGLAIETRLSHHVNGKSLFQRVLGHAYGGLPAPTREMHRGHPAVIAEGEARVAGAANAAGALVARLFGFPGQAEKLPLRVIIESIDGGERWSRFFAGRPMRSEMRATTDNMIEERFGPVAVTMRLEPRPDGLDMVPQAARLGPVPLPSFLRPRIRGEERVDALGRHRFDVDIGLPLIGRLVAYSGYLRLQVLGKSGQT
jgi:NAD(P)-dependent dehydrogenase (short-subunit alcohol dehydrogenase family)